MTSKYATSIKHILLFCAILFLLYSIEWLWYPSFSAPTTQNPDLCLDFLKQGKLYGGDPYCFQGPFIYVLLFFFSLLLPSLSVGTTIFYFLSLLITSYLLIQIQKKETGKENMLFVYFIALFLLGRGFTDISTASATLFALLGFYLFYYTSLKWKYFIAGLFFSFALLSKQHNTPLVIGPAILFYFGRKYFLWKKEEKRTSMDIIPFLKSQKKNIIMLFAPILFFFLLAIIFLNHFLLYNYIIHLYNPVVQTYGSMIKELVTFTYWYNGLFLLLYLGIFISALRFVFYKKFDLFSFVACVSFPILVLLVGNKFSLYKLIDQYRYIIPLAPFYVMNIFCFVEEFKKNYNKKALCCVLGIIITFLFIFYMTIGGLTVFDILENHGINDQKFLDRIKYDVERPLLYLPETEGKILVEYDYFHRYDLLFDETPYKYVHEEDFQDYYKEREKSANDPDMAVAENFIKIGLLDTLTSYFHNATINRAILLDDLLAGAYPTLLVGPYVNDYAKFLKDADTSFYTCKISMPLIIEGNTERSSQFVLIYFKDKKTCSSFAKIMQEYYMAEFNTLCARGESYIKIISDSMEYNDVPLTQSCTNKKQLYLINNRIKLDSLFFCMLLIGYITYCFVLALKKKQQNVTNNKTAADTQTEETQQKDST